MTGIDFKKIINEGLIFIFLISTVFIQLSLPALANAKQIPPDKAVRVLIGEAADQGFKGMVCVAEVLRRRGSLKGFYGYRSKIIRKQPKEVWEMARKA